jgi:hypothetical protein
VRHDPATYKVWAGAGWSTVDAWKRVHVVGRNEEARYGHLSTGAGRVEGMAGDGVARRG